MPDSSPFWLCHECGAQMRPITRDNVPHCASCDGEFIEILDPDVNPDPFHELPPPPQSRPGASASSPHPPPSAPASPNREPGEGAQSFLSSLFGNILGAAAGNQHDQQAQHRQGDGQAQLPSRNQGSASGSGSASGARTFQFNFPGGGRGQVVFGSLGGGGGMGPFGPTGQTAGGMDFESLFPQGFGPQTRQTPGQQPNPGHPLGPGDPMDGVELLRALMSIIGEEGAMPPHMFFGGTGGRANLGDYATSEQGFSDILERLMQAAGPQGPLPASDVVINGLPRFKFDDEKKLAESTYKDCPVCKDDFVTGDEVIRIPCAHIFHPDCLVPWLKTNGSCPVCRFSLVPEEEDWAPRDQPQEGASHPQEERPRPPPTENGQSTVTSILNRLFGQSGATANSNPTSPTTEPSHTPFGFFGNHTHAQGQGQSSGSTPSAAAPARAPSPPSVYHSDFGAVPVSDRSATPPTTSGQRQPEAQSQSEEQPAMSTAIPEDYRARHRERERERQRNQEEGVDYLDLD